MIGKRSKKNRPVFRCGRLGAWLILCPVLSGEQDRRLPVSEVGDREARWLGLEASQLDHSCHLG